MKYEIIKTLEAAGFQARLVGGCVRDLILGRTPSDFDIVTMAMPDQICETLSQYTLVEVGKSFGVIKVVTTEGVIDVATTRADGNYTDGRRPTDVQFLKSFRCDASRRDFTINAMMLDQEGGIIDYFGGREDLQNRIIRTIGDPYARFNEDYLRMLRAVRFAVQLDFNMDYAMQSAIRSLSEKIQLVSAERVSEELRKILISGNASRGLALLRDLNLLQYIIPEFVETWGPKGEQDPKHHPEGNVWIHTIQTVRGVQDTKDFVLICGALLHDIGKPATQEIVTSYNGIDNTNLDQIYDKVRISNLGHDKVGAEMSRVICERLRLTSKETEGICDLVRLHMIMHNVDKLKRSKLISLLSREDIGQLTALQDADSLSADRSGDNPKSRKDFILSKILELKAVWQVPPILTGADLIAAGYKPGPSFKSVLNKVREAQLEGELSTKAEALEAVKLLHLTTGKI